MVLGLCSHTNRRDNKVYSTSLSNEGQNLFQNDANLWHHRLGHIPFTRLCHVPGINVHSSNGYIYLCYLSLGQTNTIAISQTHIF